METNTVRFAKLNGSNYHTWSVKMQMLLEAKDFWDLIVGEESLEANATPAQVKAFQKRLRQARANIVLNVEDSQLPHCQGETPQVVWSNLAKIHQSQGWASRLSLRRQFISLRKTNEMSMQAHIAQVLELSSRLNSIGVKITEEDKILVLLNGLPDTYSSLVMTLEGMSETTADTTPDTASATGTATTTTGTLSFDYVTSRLLNEEARRTDDYQPTTEAALRARASTDLSNRTCWRCGGKGHISRDCTKEFPDHSRANYMEVF